MKIAPKNNGFQRDIFWNTVYDYARTDPDIVIISADMGAPSLDRFRRDMPTQFVNVGIAEQNAIMLATGLVLTGKKVFTYAIAPFITLRCLEQIRVENAIMRTPITIVGVGAGFGYDDSGPTHHMIEDIAIMRAMPHIRIDSISDGTMAAHFAKISCAADKTITNYVRLDRQDQGSIYPDGTDFSRGLLLLRQEGDTCLVTTGSMTLTALAIADSLAKKGLRVGVMDLFNFPINESAFLETIRPFSRIITIEEHLLAGGLGSTVLEVVNDHQASISVHRFGISMDQGYCYKYGGREVIRQHYGLDKKTLLKKISTLV
ncbi:MAG: transketolase C-terminal domain-containing protein [Thermodesulfobacteriota bacterium]